MADKEKSLEEMLNINDFSVEEIDMFAQVFDDYKDSPLLNVWNKLFDKALAYAYFQMAHLPNYKPETVAFISGQIREVEFMKNAPQNFKIYLENKEKEKEEKGKSA